MSALSRIAAPLAAVVLIAGCVPTESEIAAHNQRVGADVHTEVAPLFDVCITTLDRGTPVDDATMSRLGFSKVAGGYVRPYGNSTLDRVSMSLTRFTATGQKCTFSMPTNAQILGNALRSRLEARGYTTAGTSHPGYKWVKDGQQLGLAGMTTNGVTQVWLEKE